MSDIDVTSKTQRIVVEPPSSLTVNPSRSQSIDAKFNRSVRVIPAGPAGPPGERGAIGPEGPKGDTVYTGEGLSYTHVQGIPETLWHIQHNLDRHPSVEVVDSAGSVVLGSIRYIDSNTVELSFAFPFSGKAYLN